MIPHSLVPRYVQPSPADQILAQIMGRKADLYICWDLKPDPTRRRAKPPRLPDPPVTRRDPDTD